MKTATTGTPRAEDNPSVAEASSTASAPFASGNVVVRTTVHVDATTESVSTDRNSPTPFHASAGEILGSAGTYGDFSRYLQLFPGVVFNTDESDDILVRGGNPLENLFLVDGIEIPNINHIASEGTTGGLVSMIDTSAIQSVDLYTGGYDASYDERLSAVVDIRTRDLANRDRHAEGDFGFIGAGGVALLPFGRSDSLLVSAHRSLLNLFTNDIGLDGVPIYSNILLSTELNPAKSDQLTLLSLSGFDSIAIKPGGTYPYDDEETNTIDTQYSGWRTTNGLRWRHIYSQRLVGVVTASDSEQQQNIQQQNQFYDIVSISPALGPNAPLTQVYSELSHDGRASLKYDLVYQPGRAFTLIAGASGILNRVDYAISQPVGEPSSLSVNPANSDSTSFAPDFLSGETGSYAEATIHPFSRWSVSAGGRVQTFALGGHMTATPRLSSALRLSQHTGLHAAFGEYAQMPPSVYITSWPQNYSLPPIRVRHIVAGSDLYTGSRGRIGIEGYQKNYSDYPVSTEYPTISLANTVDTLGAQFLWIPLTSQGTGVSRGVELFGETRLGSHIVGQANVAYARAEFAALDGVLRPGNFDYPIVANASGSYRSAKHYEASGRYEYTTGRPYTPFLNDASLAQNRPIYDLLQVNALRGPFYSRLDFETDRSFYIGDRKLVLYGGLDNAFNRTNFLGYYWMPRIGAYWQCGGNVENCISEQHEMVRFPDFGVRYIF
jgi:hypothetical protein